MTLATLGDLKQALDDYTGRGAEPTYVRNRGLFVHRAHTTLMRELRIPMLQASADLTLNAETAALPSDFRAVVRLFIDGQWDNVLQPTAIENRLRLAVSNAHGRPQAFALEGAGLSLAPIPDTAYAGKLIYYRTLPALIADSDTNALLVRHPFAYLYGALAEWARFDKADEEIDRYDGLFSGEMNAVQLAEQLDAMSGGTLQPSPSGIAV